MTSLADRTIAALRSTHDDLAQRVPELSDEQLTGPSGAADWTVAQVLSHLGSGAEISLASFSAALARSAPPEQDFNRGVWARWNALGPQDQAAQFLRHDAALVERLEALSAEEREKLEIAIGFLPEPLSVATAAGMRLNEAVQHSWDVRVALDPAATLDGTTANVLVEHLTGGMRFLLGFVGKAAELSEPAVVRIAGSDVAIMIDDQVSLSTSASQTASTAIFTGELEAAIRLMEGRLTSPHTPQGVEVTGNVTLDQLRRVFPGY